MCPWRKVTAEKMLNEEPLLMSQPALGPWQKWQLLLRKKRRWGWSTWGHWFSLPQPSLQLICFLQAFEDPWSKTSGGILKEKRPRVGRGREVGTVASLTSASASISEYGFFPFHCPEPSVLLFIWPGQQTSLTYGWCDFWARLFRICMKQSQSFTLFFLIGLKREKIQQNDRWLSFWCYPS